LQAFAYWVSHDLRTPVRHITGFLKLARISLDGQLDQRTARYLDVIDQAGVEMNTLIDALLDLSRTSQLPLRMGQVNLSQVLARIQEAALPELLDRDVQWEIGVLPIVTGDFDALRLVMTQLIENALKFTRDQTRSVIRVWSEDRAIRSSCSRCSSVSTAPVSSRGTGLAWPGSGESSSGMEARCSPRACPDRERPSASPSQKRVMRCSCTSGSMHEGNLGRHLRCWLSC